MKKLICLAAVLQLFFMCSCYSRNHAPSTTGRSVIEETKPLENDRVVVFKATGKGMAPETAVRRGEAMILGERAAVLDGYRLLLEKLRGALVDTYSKRKGVEINMDTITSQARSYLKGVEILETKVDEFGIYHVDMQVRVFFAYNNELIWWPTGLSSTGAFLPAVIYEARTVPSRYARCEGYPWCGGYYYYGSEYGDMIH
ncbi:hypothetical protein [uncultured Desulfobacter sp.]|uniref:hypothetical protein n=1 Tax=uncultured Desulfobacter sp. TaxID=240139 RepID=UPI002AAC1282|nr:hypothetical protein [uncultured Desulfobacter sp.]